MIIINLKVLILITFIANCLIANEINSTRIKITHLYELNETTLTTEKSIDDNNIPKPIRKKPYAILEKPSEIDKQRQKEYESNSGILDLNIDHLEDEHQSIRNIGLSRREQDLLIDDDSNDSDVNENFMITNINHKDSLQKLHTTVYNAGVTTQHIPVAQVKDSNVGIDTSNSNIFKVAKTKTKNKGINGFRKAELHKNNANHFNSLNELPSAVSAAQPVALHAGHHNPYILDYHQNENIFHILMNAYDHFYWQPSELHTKLAPACGIELLAYISALKNSIGWAQRAYDASGHYRGQILFGNNLWLGQKTFCNEVNLVMNERKHFEFGYTVSTIAFTTSLPTNISNVIQLGECLPKSCSPLDIKTILESDPHIRYLISLNSTSSHFQVIKVRSVPGDYNIWKELKFKIFCAFIVFIIALMSYASWLEIYIKNRNRDQLQKKITSISENYDNKNRKIKQIHNEFGIAGNGLNDCDVDSTRQIEKTTFELYQMDSISSVEDNNNIEMSEPPLEINKFNKNENGNGKFNGNLQINDNTKSANDPVTIVAAKGTLGFLENLILCFSFSSNVAAICTFQKRREDIMPCVHGIRVFSLLWTIMVHTYLQMFLIGENRFKRNISERSFAYQVIGNATFSVDSFFFLSGLLVVLIFLKNEKRKEPTTSKEFIKKGCSKSIVMIIYRYVRLTPVYLFGIIFTELSLNYVFNNTVHIPTTANLACKNYWWRNILYINNFYPFTELCMIWSWYLANDMQFYILAVLLLIISTRYIKVSVISTFVLLCVSWGTAGIVSIHFQYMHKVADPFESFDFLYDKPWQRIGPYIIGMMTGYISFKNKIPPKVPFSINFLLWVLSVGLLFILIFGVWNGQLNILATAFYVSVGHTAWGLGLVWITLSCYWNLSPSINKFLSYEFFLPLSRLTYCTYLIHPTIMMITSFLMEGPIHLQHTFILTVFLGNAVLSFLVAFFMSVAFEAPVIRLTKIFVKKN